MHQEPPLGHIETQSQGAALEPSEDSTEPALNMMSDKDRDIWEGSQQRGWNTRYD